MSKDQRKNDLKSVLKECDLLLDADLIRVQKYVKVLLKSRTAAEALVDEVDAEE